MNITGGQAHVYRDISGASSANNTLTITPGAGNSFSDSGNISNFTLTTIGNSTVNYSGTWNNAGTINNTGNFNNGGTLNNSGIVTGLGSYAQSSGATLNSGSFSQAALNITGGTFTQAAGGTTNISGKTSNAGKIIINGSNPFTSSGTFANTGSLVVNSGAKLITGNFNQTAGSTLLNNGTIDPPAPISVTGGTFGGTGKVDGNMNVNNATIMVGTGTLNITGSFSQTSGELVFGIDGSNSLLQIGNGYSISGTNIVFNFTNAAPSSFNIQSFISGSGTFTHDNFLYEINGGNASSLIFNQVTGNLSVAAVPEPDTYAMLLSGLALVGFIAGRRKST